MNAFVAFASSGLRTGQLQPPEPASAGDCFRDYFHYSGCGTPCQQSKRVGGEAPYMMTGGVSKNRGLVKTLEEKLGAALLINDKAQLCGALGAALFAADLMG